VAENTPPARRPLAVSATIVCIPLGGFLGGVLAGQIVPAYGWQALFVAGGLLPIVLALAVMKVLPESPEYLAARSGASRVTASGSIGALFAPDLRRDTSALMLAFMSCLLAIWIGFLWIPAMLTDPAIGFSQADASYALSLFNFGGVAGALIGAVLIQRFGSRVVMLAMTGLTVAASLAMVVMPPSTQALFRTMALFGVTGALMNAVQTTMYALAAHVFPTAIRGTGVGTTVAVGRIGNVMASYVAAWAISVGGTPLYFGTWAIALTITFCGLALIQRHIPRG
jgi:AAHS family 4-hydroxybenzoate transporter-like MFS transporter